MAEVKKDCFAYRPSVNGSIARCNVLTALYCKQEECKFYKTPEQACMDCTYKDCKGCINPLAND